MIKVIKRKYATTQSILQGVRKNGFLETFIRLFQGTIYTFTGIKFHSKKTKRNFLQFEFRIVEHCNLNCKGCCTFAPLATENYLSMESIEKDLLLIKNLNKNDIVKIIKISGGEPLLHPDLLSIINLTRNFFPSLEYLDLITNGLLLLNMGEGFWETLVKNKVRLLITKYPNLSYENVTKKVKETGLRFQFLNYENEDKKMWKYNINLKGTENHKKQFTRCSLGNKCMEIKNGKFYTCVFPAHVHNFNTYFEQNIPITQKDYLNIDAVKSIDEILAFAKKPMPICRFCNSQIESEADIPWEKSKREMSEWV